jgi:hypothetical protein
MLTLGITYYNNSFTSFQNGAILIGPKTLIINSPLLVICSNMLVVPSHGNPKNNSTVEAKYMTVASAIKEALWIYQLVSNPN